MDRRKEETTADTAMDLGHIVVTRLMPFAQHTQLLQRPQLLTRLDCGLDASLILVQAPAGYGKTTLLAQWRERLLAAGEQVAWVSLDEEDDNPATLVSYLSCALHQAGLDLAPALYTTLAGDENEAKHRLRRLLNAIAASGRRIVLILDEFERVPPTVAGMVFPFLVAMAPPNLVLAIASRELPAALPLATLRARGMAVELRADDLHFSDHEIGALFDGRLSRKDLCAVVEKTNGWPVALQLLRGWWQRKGQSPQEIALLDQATPDIAEYLSEQILAALPPAQRTFLAEASVLDRLSAGALEQVVGSSDGWRDILAADALRPFIIPIDTDVGVYRLHPIFNDALALEFQNLPAERRREMKRAAARWYARAGQLARAVRSALEGEDLDLAGRIVEDAGGVQIWIRYGMSRSKAVEATFTEPLLERFPRLRLLRALLLLKDGQINAARREFELTRGLTQNFTRLPQGNVNALRLDSMVVEITLLVNECRPVSDDYLATYEREMQTIAKDDHVMQAHTENSYCISCHQRGLFDKAVAAAHESIDHYRQANLSHGEFFNYLHLGVINFAQGSPATALAFYDRAKELARSRFPDDATKRLLMDTLTAEIAYEQGNLGQAKTLVRKSLEQIRRSELWYDIFAAEFLTAALVATQQDGIGSAMAILDDARLAALERQASGMTPFLTAAQILCLLMAGQAETARSIYNQAGFQLDDYIAPKSEMMWRERELVLLATLRLAARDAGAALPLSGIQTALATMWDARHIRSAIRLTVALCGYHCRKKQTADALPLLPRLLKAVAVSGYVQPLVEEGETFLPFLHDALEQNHLAPDSRHHAQDLLDRLHVPSVQESRPPRLTSREREVLRELGRGFSDKIIARELGLTENTVKYHLKNVYAKFQVKNRTEAVHKGYHFGYLS